MIYLPSIIWDDMTLSCDMAAINDTEYCCFFTWHFFIDNCIDLYPYLPSYVLNLSLASYNVDCIGISPEVSCYISGNCSLSSSMSASPKSLLSCYATLVSSSLAISTYAFSRVCSWWPWLCKLKSSLLTFYIDDSYISAKSSIIGVSLYFDGTLCYLFTYRPYIAAFVF